MAVKLPPSRLPHIRCLQIQWGWITPGTNHYLRQRQAEVHIKTLQENHGTHFAHYLFAHCGWWLDHAMDKSVRSIFTKNPEPHRAMSPANSAYIRDLVPLVTSGRIEFVAYPYAACVAEATTGEALLRTLRMTSDIAFRHFGKRPRVYLNHDAVYGLDWGTVQMPQILRLLDAKYVISGRIGTIAGIDGTTIRTFGNEGVFYDHIRNPASMHKSQVFCMELHDHLHFMQEQVELGRFPRIQVRAITLDSFLHDNCLRKKYPAEKIGTKGWYGGIVDALQIEQCVKSVEIRLPAIEAVATQLIADKSVFLEMDNLWKSCFILMDNHLLWQCHQYKPHFTSQSRKLAKDVRLMESRILGSGSRSSLAFNPVPWKRDIVITQRKIDTLIPSIPGWGSRKCPGSSRSNAPRPGKSSPWVINAGKMRYKLDEQGAIEGMSCGDYHLSPCKWGKLSFIHDRKIHSIHRMVAGHTRIHHQGCMSIECHISLTGTKGYSGILELGEIHGDAYLLRIERFNLNGEVFCTKWESLRSLHWGGNALPSEKSGPWSIPIDTAYASGMRFTVWVASQDHVSLGKSNFRTIRYRHHPPSVMPLDWKANLLTEVNIEGPSRMRARVLRDSGLSKCIRFTGRIGEASYALLVTGNISSPRLEYHLCLEYSKPTHLGLSTPPFSADEGSLLGAQCERPYVPGLCVELALPHQATYHADKPYFIQKMLGQSSSTWHTDVRNWWMGMSPFIGMNMAVSSWKKDSVGMLTRGLKHFFRWRRSGQESLALSLGATIPHVATQGYSIKKSSPLYSFVGTSSHNPYSEINFLKAHGTYEYHYAIHPGCGRKDPHQLLSFWRSAQEFALPPSVLSGKVELEGIESSNPSVIPTALETRCERRFLRLVNMSNKPQATQIRLPSFLPSAVKGKISPKRNILHAKLKPGEISQFEIF